MLFIRNKSAITKIQAAVVVIVLIIAIIAGVYYYYSTRPPEKVTLTFQSLTGWPPAFIFLEQSKKFAEIYQARTGIEVEVVGELLPYAATHDRLISEFSAKGTTFDFYTFDSQWLGEFQPHLLELTDWMNEVGPKINFDDFHPMFRTQYGEWPPNSGKIWALPWEVDAQIIAYRTDLFEDPNYQDEFKAKYGYDLAPPKTWVEFRDMSEFFTKDTDDDGEVDLWGAGFKYTRREDGITCDTMSMLWTWGGEIATYPFPEKPEVPWIKGVINTETNVEAFSFLIDMYQNGWSPPGSSDWYFDGVQAGLQSGIIAMGNQWASLCGGLLDPEVSEYYDKIGFIPLPTHTDANGVTRSISCMGGWGIAVNKYADPYKQQVAKDLMEWWLEYDQQREFALLGGFTGSRTVLKDSEVLTAYPFIAAFAQQLELGINDFWKLPEYWRMVEVTQELWNKAVIGELTPKEALDMTAERHFQILSDAGYYEGLTLPS